MNMNEYLGNADVQDFIAWLTEVAPTIGICFDVKSSRFVPNGVRRDVEGFDAVLQLYNWRSVNMAVGDWQETRQLLAILGYQLRQAVNDPVTDPIPVIRDILAWGGNRNWRTGAFPFLQQKSDFGTLSEYIQNVGQALTLGQADTNRVEEVVENMNSMLTKVHALYSTDGLPIYDSRVAAAIATLVELWRVYRGFEGTPIPELLAFPAIQRNRTVKRRFPRAQYSPPLLNYNSPSLFKLWASAKIRLGWIMHETLLRNQALFEEEQEMSARMHAFEAVLFMIGYDVSCLQCAQIEEQEYQAAYAENIQEASGENDNINKREIQSLSGRGQPIIYTGSLDRGWSIQWGSISFSLVPEQILDIQVEFGGRQNIHMGASRTDPPMGSFGAWLRDNGWPSSSYATPIAAVLRDVGVIENFRGQKPIILSFA